MTYIILALLLFISFFGTYFFRKLAIHKKVLDIPSERSSHNIPTPKGGGLAIVLTWYLGITGLFFLSIIEKKLYFALLTGILLAFISLLDDLISLKPLLRLIIQCITAVVALWFLKGVASINVFGFVFSSPLILFPVTILGMIWFINLFNFMDGIDGYASIECVFIVLAMYIFTGSEIFLVLVASVLGFLYWNWPKAKIFMGDVGSTQLGFVLIILGIYYHNTTDFKIIYWIMLSSLFWFDATLTLVRRWINRENLSLAHKKHAYQRIVQAGFSHLKTDIYAMFINILILILVFITYYYKSMIVPGFLLTILLLICITWTIDKKYHFSNNGQ